MKPPAAQARSPTPANPAMVARLRARAGPGGVLSFRDFVNEALYAPGLGYYARPEVARVGRKPSNDFYTSTSLGGGIFGRLVRAAAAALLAPEPLAKFALVEIGMEPGAGIFGGDAGDFARTEAIRLGESLQVPSRSAVFANEWLDAQPFHRFVFRGGAWRELGVNVTGEFPAEIELPEFSPAALPLAPSLPETAPEGYHFDLSLDAEKILGELVAPPWLGCLILADYGYDWVNLLGERPAGTARAYSHHQVSGDLLAQPGQQDLTCHVCWDRLENVLREQGFSEVRVERQEAFFVRHSAREIEEILSTNAGQFSPARQTLLELLHPSHLGQKFQILSARRK